MVFNKENNWEEYLDSLFAKLKAKAEKQEFKGGLKLNYTKNDIYVWCTISVDRLTIKKLEFGRYLPSENQLQKTNWIKGVFVNQQEANLQFLQTSFDSEWFDKQEKFIVPFNECNVNRLSEFLKIPCNNGWTEIEYLLDEDKFYKVVVELGRKSWTIPLLDIGEQDLPMLTDKLDVWLRVKIGDAFWNNGRRTVRLISVKPMN